MSRPLGKILVGLYLSLISFTAVAQDSQSADDSEVLVPATNEVAPADVEPAPAVEQPSIQTAVEAPRGDSVPSRKALFGTYRLRLSINKPTFGEDLKFYEDLYGAPKNYGMFGADWFAWDWYVTFGLGLRGGFYGASGQRVKSGSVNRSNPDPAAFAKTGKTTLTVLPLQALLTMEFTPFERKWLVIDGWFGSEYAYWQEVRVDEAPDSKASINAGGLRAATAATADEGSLTNKGWAPATVVGIAANILLNPLDDRGVKSMESTMGLGYVYLTPFMEIVTSTKNEGVNWGRKVFGLGFTFESVK